MKKALIATLVLLAACGGSPSAARTAQTTSTTRTAGPLGDAWGWDAGAWHRASNSGPTPRYSAAMAYDADHKLYVLFGGQTAQATTDETWTWDGGAWKMQTPAHKPPPRRTAAMAYDPSRHAVVLYGGHIPDAAEGTDAGDTWTWDGTDWTQLDIGPGAPDRRDGPRMVTAGNRVLLFGGHSYNLAYFGDAWSLDGSAWSRVDKGPKPSGRANSAVAWDPVDSSLFVFGGTGINASGGPGAQGPPVGEGWLLTRGTWTQLVGSGPPPLALANAIWDSAGNRFIVLQGMTCPKPTDAAWAWDGRAWSQLASTGIPARWGAAFAQAPDGKALLFGGSDEAGC